MQNDILFLLCYLLISLTFLAVQTLCFFYSIRFSKSNLMTYTYVLVSVIFIAVQVALARDGKFPFGLLSEQNVYVDTLVRDIAMVFGLTHIAFFYLLNMLANKKRDWLK